MSAQAEQSRRGGRHRRTDGATNPASAEPVRDDTAELIPVLMRLPDVRPPRRSKLPTPESVAPSALATTPEEPVSSRTESTTPEVLAPIVVAPSTRAEATFKTTSDPPDLESPAVDPTAGSNGSVTVASRRRQRRAPIEPETSWWRSQGRALAIVFVVALSATIYFALSGRTDRKSGDDLATDAIGSEETPLVEVASKPILNDRAGDDEDDSLELRGSAPPKAPPLADAEDAADRDLADELDEATSKVEMTDAHGGDAYGDDIGPEMSDVDQPPDFDADDPTRYPTTDPRTYDPRRPMPRTASGSNQGDTR